jgi:hypothetical protein
MSRTSNVGENQYRRTSDDGRTSALFERSSSFFGEDKLIELADHQTNGKTSSYDPDLSLTGIWINGGRKSR